MRRRISRPRVHKPSFALLELAGIEIGQFRDSTNHAASVLWFRPLRTGFSSRMDAAVDAMSAAVPETDRRLPQDRNTMSAADPEHIAFACLA